MKKFLIAAAGAAFVATPALAADFTGPRIEGRLSYDRVTLNASASDGIKEESGSVKDEGLGLGGEIGFDAQLGTSFVGGAYVGAESSSARFTGQFDQDSLALEFNRSLYAGVRGGFNAGPALLYVKGGLSSGRIWSTPTLRTSAFARPTIAPATTLAPAPNSR